MAAEGEFAMEKLFGVVRQRLCSGGRKGLSQQKTTAYTISSGDTGDTLSLLTRQLKIGGKGVSCDCGGHCASDGGISAARPNPAACVPVQSLLTERSSSCRDVRAIRTCFIGTLGYILLFGEPALDSSNRPLMFLQHINP
jgi:hydrogenase small subunit